jgi:hypothetical protein
MKTTKRIYRRLEPRRREAGVGPGASTRDRSEWLHHKIESESNTITLKWNRFLNENRSKSNVHVRIHQSSCVWNLPDWSLGIVR